MARTVDFYHCHTFGGMRASSRVMSGGTLSFPTHARLSLERVRSGIALLSLDERPPPPRDDPPYIGDKAQSWPRSDLFPSTSRPPKEPARRWRKISPSSPEVAARAMRLGSKIPLSGDGGGAADLQHTASEHTARMERASASLPALCPLDAPRGARGARRAPAPSAAVPVTQTKNIHPSPRLRRPRARTAPPPEGRETRPVVAEPGMPAVGLTVDVERVFGNVDADGILHCLSSPALVVRGNACSTPTYPFRTCERRGRSNF